MQPWNTPPTLTANSRSKSAAVWSSSAMPRRGVGMPTLLNTMSSRPNCSTAASDRRDHVVLLRDVDGDRHGGAAGLLDSRTVSLAASTSRSAQTTLAPSSAKRRAEARPTPEPAPVIDGVLVLEQHVTSSLRSVFVGRQLQRPGRAGLDRGAHGRSTSVVGLVEHDGLGLVVLGRRCRGRRRRTSRCRCSASRSTPSVRADTSRHRRREDGRLGRREPVQPLGVAPQELVLRVLGQVRRSAGGRCRCSRARSSRSAGSRSRT